MKLLVVVDMQNDFINGSLGTKEAQGIVSNVVEKISKWDGDIICTQDTHPRDYLMTNEGKHLPIEHCIMETAGRDIDSDVSRALFNHGNDYPSHYSFIVSKPTFGSTELPRLIHPKHYDCIELIGLCTDICVISNALILKAHYPEVDITIDASCCAGVTPESHRNALAAMKVCQIQIINE